MTRDDFNPIFVFIWRKRKVNLLFVIVAFIVLTIYVFFIMDKYYTATASIIPSASSFTSNLSSKLGALAGLAGLGSLSNTGQSQEMYQGIIHSRQLQSKLLETEFQFAEGNKKRSDKLLNILDIYGSENREILEKAYKMLNKNIIYTDIDVNNYLLYINVTLENPFLASLVANKIVEYLDEMVRMQITNEYHEQYDYLKERISVIEDSIHLVETEHKDFLEATLDLNLPKNIIEEMRLRRQLMVHSTIYAELKKQEELFVLENMINLSPIKVLDYAEPPYRKSRPKRILVFISLFIIVIFIQFLVNSSLVIYRRFRSNILPQIDG